MFNYYDLNLNNTLINYDNLVNSFNFEELSNGRKSCVLSDIQNNFIPIVRTTTKYNNPIQNFNTYTNILINNIKKLNNNISFNNSLVEIYDNNYKTMKYHSDQQLDLKDNSYICIFSCYSNPKTNNFRKLFIKNKLDNNIEEYVLKNNSIIIFSTDTNKKYLHKIILDKITENTNWLGITLRLSKTFINFIDNKPYINNNLLYLASLEEEKKFYKLRKDENLSIEYKYPDLNYTISPSDLLLV